MFNRTENKHCLETKQRKATGLYGELKETKIMEKLKLKILKPNDVIRFKPKDYIEGGSNLGHAEFDFCVKWKYGKIKEVLIFHRQQRDIKNYYKIVSGFSTEFLIQSWTHKGIDLPNLWRISYCKEHKSINHSVYVPLNSNCFSFSVGTSIDIYFDNK